MVSYSNSKLYKYFKNYSNYIKQFTDENLVRIYPGVSHLNSSNYDPIPFWL